MNKEAFQTYIEAHQQEVTQIRNAACALHQSVGQTYDHTLPYGYHLCMVADAAITYGHETIATEEDILPLIFGAYYHDSIEDARLSYNDVRKLAAHFMTEEQALTAAEIVYALTNDKGRTRNERAGAHYYAGIRSTPYAPLVKLCDRYANTRHSQQSAQSDNAANRHMYEVYSREWPHFIEAIRSEETDQRFQLPQELIQATEVLLSLQL